MYLFHPFLYKKPIKVKKALARGEMDTQCQGKGGREKGAWPGYFGLGHCQVESARPLPDDPTPTRLSKK
jgi:hypothetical protein